MLRPCLFCRSGLWGKNDTLHMVGKAAGSWNPMRVQSSFFEETKKGDYEVELPLSVAEATKRVKEGASLVIPESKKWIREVTQKYRADELLFSEHGDYENLWKFGNQEVLDSWVTTADRDHNEGQSTAEFVLGPGKQGIFRGNLSVDVPKDGKTKQSGYCNIRSPMNHKSFKRVIPYDWGLFNHLLLRLRGDGRSYMIVLGTHNHFDVRWNDTYSYPLYTRGGPYWQLAKIPFSKFFLSSKGRIQDVQKKLHLDRVEYLSITLADGNPGPFELELDYIALLQDEGHFEEFAYENYGTSGSCLM